MIYKYDIYIYMIKNIVIIDDGDILWFYNGSITLTMGHSESAGSQGMLDSVAKQLCSRLGLAPPTFLGVLESGGFFEFFWARECIEMRRGVRNWKDGSSIVLVQDFFGKDSSFGVLVFVEQIFHSFPTVVNLIPALKGRRVKS